MEERVRILLPAEVVVLIGYLEGVPLAHGWRQTLLLAGIIDVQLLLVPEGLREVVGGSVQLNGLIKLAPSCRHGGSKSSRVVCEYSRILGAWRAFVRNRGVHKSRLRFGVVINHLIRWNISAITGVEIDVVYSILRLPNRH